MTKYIKPKLLLKKTLKKEWKRKFTAALKKINKKYHQVLRHLAK